MANEKKQDEHGEKFIDYYERASRSERTITRFTRIRDCALRLLQERGNGTDGLDIADIGCGAGTQAMLWAEQGHKVAALDASESLIAIGQRRAAEKQLDVRFSVGWAQSLPFESERFDVVLLPELLEHVAEWESCLLEAVRVLRTGGILYVSTTNKLCPVQQEFNLPLYSWYPPKIKRWCESKSLSTRPEWANHTRYPAVNWFSYFGLRRWFDARGIDTLDRFDVLSRQQLADPARLLVNVIRRFELVRFLAQSATEGTTVWGLKRPHGARSLH
jgi:2-polyprenyl-6-hydroxyphenyl methylase/3-demethylubiquinone-9 3-methyltransferase